MSERWAVANGNWSAPATWNGGTLPAVGDDVYANNRTVTVDISVTAKSLNTRPGTTAVAGGGFTLGNGITITAAINAGTTNCVNCTGVAGNNSFIVGNITGSNTTAAIRGINNTSAGTLTVTGIVTGGSLANAHGIIHNATGLLVVNGNCVGGVASGHGVNLASTGTVQITGNCIGGTGGSASGVSVTDVGFLTITGDCIGGVTSNNRGVWLTGIGFNFIRPKALLVNNVTITGNCIGNEGNGLLNQGNVNVLVTGNATGGPGVNRNSAAGIWNQAAGTVTVQGQAIGSATSIVPGVYSAGTVPVVIGGAKFGALGCSPCSGPVVRTSLAGATLEIRDSYLSAIVLS